MRKHASVAFLATSLVLAAIAGCGVPGASYSPASNSPTPTGSESPTPTGSATPTGTSTATATPTPTASSTPVANSCVSNFHWVLGDLKSTWMHPGVDCVACHATSGGPDLYVGGTVYAANGQEDDCGGVSGVTVTITEANGTQHQLTSNYTGNFYIKKSDVASFQYPYTVSLTMNGQTRTMSASQSNGGCNSCHTQNGTQGAPGRVLEPGVN